MHKHHVRIHPSSRTDRVCMRISNFFHFDTELNIDNKQWQYAMNRALPDDIYVKMYEMSTSIFIVAMTA